MTKKRWFRFHIDQWFNGTFGMKPNEIAAYVTVMVKLYDSDGEIEYNVQELSMRCGMRPSSFQKAIEILIFKRRKINLIDGKLSMNSVNEEMENRTKLGEKSFKSRSKVVQKYPKNPLKTIPPEAHTKHRIQNTEEKEDFSFSFDGVCVSFSTAELGNLYKAFPNSNVQEKMSDESFVIWAIKQDRTNPKNVISKYFASKERTFKSDAFLQGRARSIGDISKGIIQ